MTLLEICEPYFQFVCRLNRSARKGASFSSNTVRSELLGLLDEAQSAASGDLASQFEKIRMPLIFFADFMIKESKLDFAHDWQEIARDYGEHAGDEKFFDLLEETMADKSASANERLTIFYTCLGLGFTGFYIGQPEYLRKMMTEISGRIRDRIDLDENRRICPEGYEHVNTADLVEPPGRRLVGIGIAVVGLIIVVFVTYIAMFQHNRRDLGESLTRLIQNSSLSDQAETPADPGEE